MRVIAGQRLTDPGQLRSHGLFIIQVCIHIIVLIPNNKSENTRAVIKNVLTTTKR